MRKDRAWVRPLVFVAGTFAMSWALWVAAGSAGPSEAHLKIFLFEFHISWNSLLVLLGNAAPAISAIVMAIEEDSLGNLIRKFRLPRASHPLFYYAFAVLGPTSANLVMLLIAEHFDVSAISRLRLPYLLHYVATNILLAPLWEELGWRGYLFPKMERQIGVRLASLGTGCIWAVWHFALYYWVGQFGVISFLINFITLVAIGITLAVLCSATGYSLILPILFHTFWNASTQWVIQLRSSYGILAVGTQAAAAWILALAVLRTVGANSGGIPARRIR